MTTFTFARVPLQPQAQVFTITLSGVVYSLRVYWNSQADAGWCLDIADSSGNPLANGLPLITGADIIGQLPELGIPGQLIMATKGDVYAAPTLANLGGDCNLYYVTSP